MKKSTKINKTEVETKAFSPQALIQDLYNLLHMTIKGHVEPEVSTAASGNAREIGRQLKLQLDRDKFNKRKTS